MSNEHDEMSPDGMIPSELRAEVTALREKVAGLEEGTKRITRMYNIACYNITELGDQKNMLGEALNTATLLLDEMLTEMRLADVTPSAKMIFSKARFDEAMRRLLGYDPQRPEAFKEDPAREV